MVHALGVVIGAICHLAAVETMAACTEDPYAQKPAIWRRFFRNQRSLVVKNRSSTHTLETIVTLLNTITVPVVVANNTVAANMGLTGSTNGVDYGTMTGQTNVTLTPAGASHPTGAGGHPLEVWRDPL